MKVVFVAAGVADMAPGPSGIPEITPQPIPGPAPILPPKVLLRSPTGRAPTPAGLTGGRSLPTTIPCIDTPQVFHLLPFLGL